MPTIQASTLEEFGTSLFVSAGVTADESRIVARSLVEANLRGHDSHGVMRIPFYIGSLKEGRLKPGAPLDVFSETAVVLACDAGWGFGQVQARRLMERLIPKAKALGVACGTLCRSGHIGRVGEYAEMAAEKGLALVAFANTHGARPRVSPPGGKSPRLGTNPLCVGVPADGAPVVLDFGTSATAEVKVRVLRIAGKTCPPGWLVDSDGNPTTDPNQLYVDPPGSILPMGGDQAYKGFGLSLVIDMLAGGLSGGLCSRVDAEPPLGNDAVFILLEPDHFRGHDHFAREVEGLSAYVRGCPPIKAGTKILLPGDPERNTLAERRAHGIPLDEGNWQQLVDLAGRLNVPPPNL